MDLNDIVNKIKNVFVGPANFFSNLDKEEGMKDAFIYYMILSLFGTILGFIVGLAFQPYFLKVISELIGFNIPQPQVAFGSMILWGFFGYILGLGLSFLLAGILHVWVLIFGGKGDYTKTYQLFVYTRTPSLILGWIPFLGSFVWIYGLVLLIIGTQKVHSVSRLKAILMYLIPVLVIIILYIVFFFVLMYMLKSNMNIMQDLLSAIQIPPTY